jgi:hypothetical protein
LDYTSFAVGQRAKVVLSAHAASLRFATADGRNDESGMFLYPTSFSAQFESSQSGMSSVVISVGSAEFRFSFSSFVHAITMFQSFKSSVFPAIQAAEQAMKDIALPHEDSSKAPAACDADADLEPNICVDAGGVCFTVFDDCGLKAQPVLRVSMDAFRVSMIPNDIILTQQQFSVNATFSASAFNTRVGHWEKIVDDFDLEADLTLDRMKSNARSLACILRIGSEHQPLIVTITEGVFTGICDVTGRWSNGLVQLLSFPPSSTKHSVDEPASSVVMSSASEDFSLQNMTGESVIVSLSDAFVVGSSYKVISSKRSLLQSNVDVTDVHLEACGVISFRNQSASASCSLIHDRYITLAIPTGPNRRVSANLHLSLPGVSVLHLRSDLKSAASKVEDKLDVVVRISRSQSSSQNQVILTSLFSVFNNIERPIVLEFMNSGVGTPFATVAPGGIDSVPIKQVSQYLAAGKGLDVVMRPVGSALLSPSLLSWDTQQPLSAVVSFTDVGMDCCVNGVIEGGRTSVGTAAPACSIVSPMYTIRNKLPMPFSFEHDGRRCVVQSGASAVVQGLVDSRNGSVVIQLLNASDGSCIGQPALVSIIAAATRAHEAVSYVNFGRQVVCVQISFRDGVEHARDIILFAPFLLCNQTNLTIEARKRKLLQSKKTEIADEIVRISPAASLEWAILPLKESNGLGKKRISIRECESTAWSDMFTVDAPGSSGTVELSVLNGTSILPVGISIEVGKGFLSRSICVHVSPLITLQSCLEFPLIVRQANLNAAIDCILPGCSAPLVWSASQPKGTVRLIQIAAASSPETAQWSIPLNVQNASDFFVRVPSGPGDKLTESKTRDGSAVHTTLRVTVISVGAALTVQFHALNAGDFVTSISNETSVSLFLKQEGCDADEYIELLPQNTMPYVWFDPTCTSSSAQKKLRVALSSSGSVVVGCYALDKIQTLKTADLMQQAGLKIFVALTCNSGFNVLHLSETVFESASQTSGPSTPKAGSAEATSEDGNTAEPFFKLDVTVPSVHISLVDSFPRELLCAYIKSISLSLSRQLAVDSPSKTIETFSANIASLQIDNELPSTRHPVLLSSSSENEGNDVFELSIIRTVEASSSVLQCPYVSFVLRNIDVCVDPVIITAGAFC